jgi:vacuolar-type H+-ATPase subunit D/Vma8
MAQAVFRKCQDEVGSDPRKFFKSSEEADDKMKGCEAFASWAESQIVKVNAKIKTIDGVDIVRVKEQATW